MKIKVHGARGSHAVCTPPSRIDEIVRQVFELARRSQAPNFEAFRTELQQLPRHQHQIYGGNTTCLEVIDSGLMMPLFLDAGTGLTAAGLDPHSGLNGSAFKRGHGRAAFLMSHTHWDHIVGLLTIPQLFQLGNEFHFYGVHKKLKERLSVLFTEENFPVPFSALEPRFRFHQIDLHSKLEFGDLVIQHFPQSHPGGSFAYRLEQASKVFVFATDTELKNIDPPHMEPGRSVYSNADLMVLDAQFSPEDFESRQGYGHASIEKAVDFGEREHAKRLLLFHQAPEYSDQQITDQCERAKKHLRKKFPKSSMQIEMAIEGRVYSV
jgi:ribonuclease BN (tRNA processing enzyme)